MTEWVAVGSLLTALFALWHSHNTRVAVETLKSAQIRTAVLARLVGLGVLMRKMHQALCAHLSQLKDGHRDEAEEDLVNALKHLEENLGELEIQVTEYMSALAFSKKHIDAAMLESINGMAAMAETRMNAARDLLATVLQVRV